MAFQTNRRGPISEINVTPFVDVMLVLLIIFMVSAPLMQSGTQVQLPKSEAGPMAQDEKQVVIELLRNGAIQVGNVKISRDELRDRLRSLGQLKSDAQIVLQADQGLSYGLVAEILGEIRASGLSRVGLATEPKK